MRWSCGLSARGLDAGPHTLAVHLQAQGIPVPSVTTIWRILTRAGVVTPEPRGRPRRTYIRFQADLPNECLQAELGIEQLIDGHQRHTLSDATDDCRTLSWPASAVMLSSTDAF